MEYQQSLAAQCAAQIRDWLTAGQQGKALLYTDKKDSLGREIAKPVEASDITILVRSRAEAALVRDALSALAIPSVYLSNRDNVFKPQKLAICFGYYRRFWLQSKSVCYAALWRPV